MVRGAYWLAAVLQEREQVLLQVQVWWLKQRRLAGQLLTALLWIGEQRVGHCCC